MSSIEFSTLSLASVTYILFVLRYIWTLQESTAIICSLCRTKIFKGGPKFLMISENFGPVGPKILPDQNFPDSSSLHFWQFLKILSKSIHNFLSYVANWQTDKPMAMKTLPSHEGNKMKNNRRMPLQRQFHIQKKNELSIPGFDINIIVARCLKLKYYIPFFIFLFMDLTDEEKP